MEYTCVVHHLLDEKQNIYILCFQIATFFWKWVYFYTENNTWARVDMESLFELNTRKGIPCLEATMYDFIYHINTIALQWQEKPPSLINEIKRIDNRTLRWSEGSRWKNALNHDYKQNNGRNFQLIKLSYIDSVLTGRSSLSGKRPKSACGKSSSC